jgi:hypothetical protein
MTEMTAEQRLRAAAEATRALVSEAAMTGFNWNDGDWAERLFANQAVLTAALKTPPAADPLQVRLIDPQVWWRMKPKGQNDYVYTSSSFMKEEWIAEGGDVETVVTESRHEGFLHRLIENAFSWALQDCNHLNPKYMDRLIAATILGMTPEQAADWNATAPEQAARKAELEKAND